MMDVFVNLLLAVLAVIPEGLPLSAAGHLAYAEAILGSRGASLLFAAASHTAAMTACAVILKKDLPKLFGGSLRFLNGLRKEAAALMSGHETSGHTKGGAYGRIAELNLIAFVLAVLLYGLLAKTAERMYENPAAAAFAFAISGILLLAASRVSGGRTEARELPLPMGIWLGVAEGLAILPGFSGIACFVTVCLVFGLGKKAAFRLAYLMSILPAWGLLFLLLWRSAASGMLGTAVFGQLILIWIISYVTARLILRKVLAFAVRTEAFGFAVYSFAAAGCAVLLHVLMR